MVALLAVAFLLRREAGRAETAPPDQLADAKATGRLADDLRLRYGL